MANPPPSHRAGPALRRRKRWQPRHTQRSLNMDQNTRPERFPSEPDILGVVLAYASLAAIWILLSDKAVSWLISDPALITLASTFKGSL
jgi:hypothetical protein